MRFCLAPLLVSVMFMALACASPSRTTKDSVPTDAAAIDSDEEPRQSPDLAGDLDAPSQDGRAELTAPPAPLVPAEWEPQAATWMQWPTQWEQSLRPDFARIITVVQQYQPLHLLVLNKSLEDNARQTVAAEGGDPDGVTWHMLAYDNSWMRDNGPVYVRYDDELQVQDWGFDAWGGNFGLDIPFLQDDSVPAKLAEILGLPWVDRNSYVLERGNLEANGAGMLVLGWDCQSDRNPDWTPEATEELLKKTLGAKTVLWVHGHDPYDLTTGHIDGIVRFVDEHTVAVARSLLPGDPNAEMMDAAAQTLAQAGLEVVRVDVPGTVLYKGEDMPAMYMNWLVGNGFVAAMAFGKPEWDNEAEATLQALFPKRDIHLIETLELWYNGGGIHCVTNDQPL